MSEISKKKRNIYSPPHQTTLYNRLTVISLPRWIVHCTAVRRMTHSVFDFTFVLLSMCFFLSETSFCRAISYSSYFDELLFTFPCALHFLPYLMRYEFPFRQLASVLKMDTYFCATQIIHEDGSSAREVAPLPSARLPEQFQQVGNSKSPKREAQINKQRSRFFVSFDTSRFFLGCVCLTIFAFPFRDLFVRLNAIGAPFKMHKELPKSKDRIKPPIFPSAVRFSSALF